MFTKLINRIIDARIRKTNEEAEERIKKIVSSKCREMVFDLFSSKQDREMAGWRGRRATVVGLLKEGIAARLTNNLDTVCEEKVRDCIYGEAFIDSVVERIRNKQLGGK